MTKAERRRLLAAIDRYKNASVETSRYGLIPDVRKEYKKAKSAMMAIIDAMAGIPKPVHEEER